MAEDRVNGAVPESETMKAREVSAEEGATLAVPDVTLAEPGAKPSGLEVTRDVSVGTLAEPYTMTDATLATPGEMTDAASGESQESQPEWQRGDIILDTYTVKEIYEGGGFGRVYRVHHDGWNMDIHRTGVTLSNNFPLKNQAQPYPDNGKQNAFIVNFGNL